MSENPLTPRPIWAGGTPFLQQMGGQHELLPTLSRQLLIVIRSFRHRGLKALYNRKTACRVAPEHREKLLHILSSLDQSEIPMDMNLPGYQCHRLRGSWKDFYAVSVSGNWRVVFRFDGGDVYDVDYDDYH